MQQPKAQPQLAQPRGLLQELTLRLEQKRFQGGSVLAPVALSVVMVLKALVALLEVPSAMAHLLAARNCACRATLHPLRRLTSWLSCVLCPLKLFFLWRTLSRPLQQTRKKGI